MVSRSPTCRRVARREAKSNIERLLAHVASKFVLRLTARIFFFCLSPSKVKAPDFSLRVESTSAKRNVQSEGTEHSDLSVDPPRFYETLISDAGPDVDWIVAGSGSVSPGTGRTRGQIIATSRSAQGRASR